MEKKCKECGIEKPLTEFYRHSAMADGHLGKCKVCVRSRISAHRTQNIDRIRAYDRARTNPDRLERNREYARTHRANQAIAKAEWGKRNRHKRNAQQQVRRAVLNGQVNKPVECDLCKSSQRLEAHHPDYSKPLEVLWLCDPCHKKIHRVARENARRSDTTPKERKDEREQVYKGTVGS